MTSWYERRDDVDHYAPADLDAQTEQLLALVRPELHPAPLSCRACLIEVDEAGVCNSCGKYAHRQRREAA